MTGKLMNLISPDSVKMSSVTVKPKNIFQRTENINAALSAAKKLGIHVVNIGAQDIIDGR